MEHRRNVLRLKGPAWGSKEETVLFYKKKKKKKRKKERKEKEKQFRMVVEKKERSAKPSCSVDFPFLKFFTVSFKEGVYFLFVYPSLVYLKWVQISTWLFIQIWYTFL